MESMRNWLAPAGEEQGLREPRLLARHRLQQVVDSLAFAHGMPFRLLLPARLEALPLVIEALTNDPEVAAIARASLGLDQEGFESIKAILAPADFEANAVAVFPQLVGEQRAAALDDADLQWLSCMLAILPFAERTIWLTEMGNPLPAYALCHMEDHWALYILLWIWSRRQRITSEPCTLIDALGMPGLVVRVLPRQACLHADQVDRDLIPIIGPYFGAVSSEADLKHHRQFCERFTSFAEDMRSLNRKHDRSEITPQNDELADALASRSALCDQEADRRASLIDRALKLFYDMEIADGDALARAAQDDWKMLAGSCAVMSQANALTTWHAFDGKTLCIELSPSGRLRADARREGEILRRSPLALRLLLADIDERQSLHWDAQTQAIQGLLSRHSPRLVEVGQDADEGTREAVPHLLRGFGDRICRHLISLFRADGATIYWLDYAQDPSRLRLCGWAARYDSTQANKDEIIRLFDERTWQREPKESEASKRQKSASMPYRVAATGRGSPDDEALGDLPSSTDTGSSSFETPLQVPRSAMAAPLLVNGRVIGVLELIGFVEGEFEAKLHRPIRKVAAVLAASMFHELQIWQMRRLSVLFSREAHRFVQERGVAAREINSMRKITQELANVFLCPFVTLWLRDPANPNGYELLGLSRERLFPLTSSRGRELIWTAGGGLDRSMICFALDLLQVGSEFAGSACRGHFIQGRFDPDLEVTPSYTLDQSQRGLILGRDFLNHGDEAVLAVRQRIFDSDSLGLRDVMAFPLLSRNASDGKVEAIGLLSLHDHGDHGVAERPAWDRTWSTTVAHIQSYLPSLLEQADLLHAPEHEARRYLLHAGRSLMIGLQDRFEQFHVDFGKVLAPGKGLRRLLDEAIDLRPGPEALAKLDAARTLAMKSWHDFEMLQSDQWLNRISEVSNLMGQYRALGQLPGVTLFEARETCDLAQLLQEVAQPMRLRFGDRVPRNFPVPTGICMLLRVTWLRMALRDLVHNAAKYATDSLEVSWDERQRLLSLSNEGPFNSRLDVVERLMNPRVQGSAGVAANQLEAATQDQLDQGLGLWGASLLCRTMNIGFQMRIRPMERTLEPFESGWKGRARYIVELNFSRQAFVPLGAASRLL